MSSYFDQKIFRTAEAAQSIIEQWKKDGHTIAFTNGCFDILHKGHVSYLQKASEKADKLIIGLNSDSSVKAQGKSINRPLQDEEGRAYVMAALGFVDMVILFDGETPIELISNIKPQALIKGADYKPEDIVGYKEVTEAGGKVVTIALEEGYSTSAIEQKIIESAR